MARLTNTDLALRIAQLEAENEALRRDIDAGGPQPDAPVVRPARGWGWALLAGALIAIGVILAPVAVVATWVKADLTDTDRFVSTFAPLARDAAVRDFVTAQTVEVINENIDIPGLTSDVVDGITSLGTGPRATSALNALKGPAAAGIQSLVQSQIASFVESDAFADVWATALRVSHRQLVAAMANDPNAAVKLGGDGTIGVQLAPIVDAAKTALVDRGIGFASRIPAINRTITVAQSDSLPAIQLGYGAAIAAGTWLPWVALAFLAAGVLVARRRAVALIVAAELLAVMMIILAIGFAVSNALFITSVSPGLIPTGVARVLFDRVAGDMRDTTVAVLVLALVGALVGWLAGPFDLPRRLRGLAHSGSGAVRDFAEARGISTGRVGEWMYRQRVLLRAALAVIAALAIVFNRPITPGLIVWTLVAAVAVIAVLELVQRPVPVVARA